MVSQLSLAVLTVAAQTPTVAVYKCDARETRCDRCVLDSILANVYACSSLYISNDWYIHHLQPLLANHLEYNNCSILFYIRCRFRERSQTGVRWGGLPHIGYSCYIYYIYDLFSLSWCRYIPANLTDRTFVLLFICAYHARCGKCFFIQVSCDLSPAGAWGWVPESECTQPHFPVDQCPLHFLWLYSLYDLVGTSSMNFMAILLTPWSRIQYGNIILFTLNTSMLCSSPQFLRLQTLPVPVL